MSETLTKQFSHTDVSDGASLVRNFLIVLVFTALMPQSFSFLFPLYMLCISQYSFLFSSCVIILVLCYFSFYPIKLICTSFLLIGIGPTTLI
jgi:hypothetical protein